MTWLRGPMSKALGKEATITSMWINFETKEFPVFYYSKEMLEGVYLNKKIKKL